MKKEENKSQKSEIGERIVRRDIVPEMRESYIDYAMSVIVARALPDVRDGLKPVHRRILYVMHEAGLHHTAKFKKCATIVGDALGKYHPHGDTAVYDSLVRMAQDFSLRYPLIYGQGNFGCFTKDTTIKLADGRDLNFEELIKETGLGKINYTYTVNSSGLISIAEIKNPRLTKKNAEIIKIHLDSGEEIKCTPNHLFMLKDGSYKEAMNLSQKDSLMPFYQKKSEKVDRLNREGAATLWKTGFTKYFQNNSNLIFQKINKNHKITKIEKLTKKEDVFDLTIEGTHNFALSAGIFVHNSIDGDSAAAYRYTEAKMAKISDEMLSDIEKETVDFTPNYDSTKQEPKVLPAAIPQLLLNGTFGIAVGMASNIPPHNLNELADAAIFLIEHPNAGMEELFKIIKGPDFPTGGLIFNVADIHAAYASGRGGVMTRGEAEITEDEKGNDRIVVTSIPYAVNKSDLIAKIAELATEKKIEGIRDIRDESNKDGLRVVIDLKSDSQPAKILNSLYKHTDLEKAFHFNMVALVDGIQPQTLSLKAILEHFIKHRRIVVERRTRFDLRKAEERAHILEGLKKALDHIDAVIQTIKKSPDKEVAHERLMQKFSLSDKQAGAILEMKLQTLAGLERQKIEDELKEKQRLIRDLRALLKDPGKISGVIKDELKQIKEKYGDERKTKIIAGAARSISFEDTIPEIAAIMILTKDGYVKRIDPAAYRAQKRGGKGIIGLTTKEEDAVQSFLSGNTHDDVLFFTNRGKVYQIKMYEIPEGKRLSKGKSILNFISLGADEKVTSVLAAPKKTENQFVTMATKKGIIKKVAADHFKDVRKSGIIAIKLQKDDFLGWANLVSKGDHLIFTTALGQALRFKESDVREMGRAAAGVTGIRFKKGDELIDVSAVKSKEAEARLFVISERGFGKRTNVKHYRLQRRGGKGIKTAKITAKTGKLISADIIYPDFEGVLAISKKGQIIKTPFAQIPELGRQTQGVRIMRLEENDSLASVACF